jgi:hypothetical protein
MRVAQAAVCLVLSVVGGQWVEAQQRNDRNLQTCLSGKYSALCDYSQLTPDQLREAKAAESRENLRTCLTGQYPALCKHSLLTPEQATQVRQAEQAANFRTCSSGKYPALCKHGLLTPDQLVQVTAAERAENLRMCMDGRYPALCKHSMLAPDQARDVADAEARAASSRPAGSPRTAQGGLRAGGCESGHWIQAVEGNGRIIKLEDGSLWEVDDVDTVTTSIWLPVSEVVVCDGKMVNVDDGESVAVRSLSASSPSRSAGSAAQGGYAIETAADDETFVINGEVFKAKTYCFAFERGDRVKFLSGSPSGACASATLLNLRSGKTCAVWCE